MEPSHVGHKMEGVWYSICWQPRDYANPNSFIELDGCPRFYYSEDGKTPSASMFENEYQHLSVKEIFKTVIFVNNEEGEPMPTHYRHGHFLPRDNPAYDAWLEKSFELNAHILDKVKARQELFQKNMFLDYSSKIIRHDMHSGINTYLPRGLSGLLKRLPEEAIKKYKLKSSLTMLEKGLKHTQAVYQGVYAFTNLVREHKQLETVTFNLQEAIEDYLKLTAYSNKVQIDTLPEITANKSLICTAIDNFIRNGLKYNNTKDKIVKLYMDDNYLVIEDNGIGMTQQEFDHLCQPYKRREAETEIGTGLGLNISNAILTEHNYPVKVEKIETGTRILVGIL